MTKSQSADPPHQDCVGVIQSHFIRIRWQHKPTTTQLSSDFYSNGAKFLVRDILCFSIWAPIHFILSEKVIVCSYRALISSDAEILTLLQWCKVYSGRSQHGCRFSKVGLPTTTIIYFGCDHCERPVKQCFSDFQKDETALGVDATES